MRRSGASRATISRNTISAVGERQIFPKHSNRIFMRKSYVALGRRASRAGYPRAARRLGAQRGRLPLTQARALLHAVAAPLEASTHSSLISRPLGIGL